jgi:hypothetical protein
MKKEKSEIIKQSLFEEAILDILANAKYFIDDEIFLLKGKFLSQLGRQINIISKQRKIDPNEIINTLNRVEVKRYGIIFKKIFRDVIRKL